MGKLSSPPRKVGHKHTEKVKRKVGRPRKIERIQLPSETVSERRGAYVAARIADERPPRPAELRPLPAPSPLADVAPTPGSELAGWINGWIEASPLENEEARRALATGMAVCRRFTDETARIKAPLHLALTDGQARMLTQALKMLPVYAEKLGVTVVDKVRKKQRRQQKAEPAKWSAPPAGKVTDVPSIDTEGFGGEDPPHDFSKAPWEE